MVNSLFDNYANCTTFKLCNENEEFGKQDRNTEREKDYRNFMILNTPPSNNKNQKFLLANSTTQLNEGVIETTPNGEKNNKNEIKPTTMFATNTFVAPSRAQLLLQTPPFQNFLSKANIF